MKKDTTDVGVCPILEQNKMSMEKLKTIDLSEAKHQLLTMPVYVLIFIIGISFTAKSKIADVFGFVTVARAEAVENKVDALTFSVNMDIAVRMVERYSADLAEHQQVTSEVRHTASWQNRDRALQRRLDLATDFRKCVVNKQTGCAQIQAQLWQ